MRKSVSIFVAFPLAVLVSSPAAAGYGYCTTAVPNSQSVSNGWGMVNPKYVSAVLDFGEDYATVTSAAKQFGAAHGTGANSGECDDHNHSRPELAAEARAKVLADTHVKNVDTGWTGSFGAAGAPAPKPESPGGFHLTIEDNGQKARTKAWDDSVLQAERERTQQKAVIAANTAESKAKHEAAMEKAIEYLKSRKHL